MRALMFDRYGDESVLQLRELPVPLPAMNEVQVKVTVAALNPVDFKLRAGLFRLIRKPALPAITGKDFAGRITALGADVRGFNIGQRVFGSVNPMGGLGSCVETLVIGTDLIGMTPENVSDEIAACLPVASGTALQALVNTAQLKAGQSVLITGASGGVGASAVQIARSIGAKVTGVCGTANVDYVKSIGADHVIDYKKTDWRNAGNIFDVIFDAAGAATFGEARAQLSSTGFYLNTTPTPRMFLTSKILPLVSKQRCVPVMLKTDAHLQSELARLAAGNVILPLIARVIGLEDVAGAQRDMEDGKIHGKVCVRIGE